MTLESNTIIDIIQMYSPFILVANTVIILILLIALLIINSKLKKLNKKYKKFMNGSDNKNIEQLLMDNINLTNDVTLKNKEIENRVSCLERNLQHCVQKVGVIRYNAFDDVGSDLSFSIALLDDYDNGVVISGIYSRESSTTYAKKIVNGTSKYVLSAEELQAISESKKMNY
ncbi:MAG TPA: DUF4446 family protein [Clostridium sp.]|nr:hypothetical protein A7W90_13560 [Clostridium sp. Bc-iso-3]HHV28538.1 DUF4446 family protein [Clostridium sp.]